MSFADSSLTYINCNAFAISERLLMSTFELAVAYGRVSGYVLTVSSVAWFVPGRIVVCDSICVLGETVAQRSFVWMDIHAPHVPTRCSTTSVCTVSFFLPTFSSAPEQSAKELTWAIFDFQARRSAPASEKADELGAFISRHNRPVKEIVTPVSRSTNRSGLMRSKTGPILDEKGMSCAASESESVDLPPPDGGR